MKRKKIIRLIAILGIAAIVVGGGTAIYLFNMPKRDVQAAQTDYAVTSTEIVTEYLEDKTAADQKYLASDGNSKILEVTGEVSSISEDFNGRKIVILKDPNDPAGVSATFTEETESSLAGIETGQTVTLKGVIRSGSAYDEDLDLYLDVIIEKSAVIQ